MAYTDVVRLEQLRSASLIAGNLMAQRGDDPVEAAVNAISAVTEITHRIFDDPDVHILEQEDEDDYDYDDDEENVLSASSRDDDDDEDDAEPIDLEDVSFSGKTLEQLETKLITDTLVAVEFDTKAAAEMLDITPQMLGKKIKKLEIEVEA